MKACKRFFTFNQFYYQYYRMDMNELDSYLFIRGRSDKHAVIAEVPDFDPDFATTMDYLFCKFKAYEMIQEELLKGLRKLEPAPAFNAGPRKKSRGLRWTGESINLVEIGCALHESGQLNDGQAGIIEIFEWLEENLQISIGIPARRFKEISRRKRLSQTRFIDKMRDAIIRKVEEENNYKPKNE